ncbi:MAG: hypothetical protein EBU90_08270 [Proteobacteria bacterium]|nr:hypothetical protein [Pseudomonadota bacterium]NBP15629.1 hypothetical protein [bacterium]
MPKKVKKLTEMHQTHGRNDNNEEVHAKTLDQIFGDDGTSRYGTLILEEYTEYLNDLNKSDLQTHASKMGLVPVDNRELLVSRLKKEFVKHVSVYKVKKPEDKKIKNVKAARDILSEGK